MLVLGGRGGEFRFELKFRCFLSLSLRTNDVNLRATKLQLQLTVNLRTKAIMISYVSYVTYCILN
jgi:hypothetical protein